MSNLIAIVGRPNVGKSTLFNRITGSRQAIVEETAGVTRDRHYGHAEWNGRKFSVIDTGGYVQGSDDIFEEEICRQVKVAIQEASMLMFVVDAMEGITPLDEDVAEIIRRSKKKVFWWRIKWITTNAKVMFRNFMVWDWAIRLRFPA